MNDILLDYMSRLTSLSIEQQEAILNEIQIEEFNKGSVLIQQGDIPTKCFFVIRGCVRQYSIDMSGREFTSNFYTEEQAIALFNHHKIDKASECTFVCAEDSVLVVGDLMTEQDMYSKYTQLESMTRQMIEQSFSEVQENFAAFIASSPEERFKSLLVKRPTLIDRVPQHQLASYLGMTPESLSRIKKRMDQE
ncbi:CRP-like cAMP-binding protein [Paenibacillus amylolyticus]|uniref:CRP-like cAMP-binding protein n=1 Tax=Paenibacillus amylolyticus TaxID=1451 RepID=A0AAP5LNK6_PAEAM|nr:Crp/Fnr family transcriptional regulator [Paenibacillus amylolyticus]MDR6721609.1 CRP-like cAMP-binding protein [Paenibacillus amylolyticus]